MSLPQSWLAAALVGTSRGASPMADLPAALAPLAEGLAGRPPGEALLLLAGAATLYHDAGRLPARAAPADWHLPAYRAIDRPACSPAAARLVRGMMAHQHGDLLPELVGALDAAGQRVPDELLPDVLDYGARLWRLRPALLPVLGERGRWLGAINPAWHWAAVELGDWPALRAAWERDPAGRAALAHIVRPRDPATALHLIEATWRGESLAGRREQLAALTVGLSMADEPFLERALDDRDALVRRRAADLLAMLAESRLVGRVTAAAGDWLALADGELLPRFPAAIGDALVRDGVTKPANGPKLAHERARLLAQTIGVIPPGHWERRLGATPDELTRAAQAGKWPRTLISAFAHAAARHRDRRWATAILAHEGLSERAGALVPLLDEVEFAGRLAASVATGGDEAVIVALRRRETPWGEAAGRAVIDYLARQGVAGEPLGPTLRYLLRWFARRCAPSLAGEAAARLGSGAVTPAWAAALAPIVKTLAMRQELYEAVNGA